MAEEQPNFQTLVCMSGVVKLFDSRNSSLPAHSYTLCLGTVSPPAPGTGSGSQLCLLLKGVDNKTIKVRVLDKSL